MAYKAYPEYESSGDTWLGNTPRGWTVQRADFLCTAIKKQITEEKLSGLEVFHYSIPIVQEQGTGCIENGDEIDSAKLLIDQPQLLVSKLNPRKATICLADKQKLLTVASGEFIQIASNKIDIKYAYYTWLSDKVTKLLSSRVQSVTRSHQRVVPEDIYKLIWAWPSRTEQKIIANFLDHKTAQIDHLIEKKQELIEKLQEQRIAIITQAVTKGLAPEAPMQNTEISWLGAIPSTWEISPLKRIISEDTRNGLYKEKDQFIADGTPFVQMGEAFAEPELTQTAKDRVNTTQGELQKWGLLEGDLLFARRSLVFEGSGKCVIIGKLQEPHLFESSMIRVRIDTQKAIPQFIFHYFQSAFSRAEILATTKTVTISGIDSQQLKGLTVCLPDIKTQGEIVDFISKSSEKFSAAITANSTTIARLMEYRTALITAAVTGQIDVRDWKAPVAAETSEQDKEVA